MYEKQITFVDNNNEKKTRFFYFHLTNAEIVEYRYSVNGGIQAKFEYVSKNERVAEMIHMIKEIVLNSYGVCDENGRFYKDEKETKAFACSDAYSVMFLEFIEEPKKFAEFIREVVPAEYADAVDKAVSGNLKSTEETQASVEALPSVSVT